MQEILYSVGERHAKLGVLPAHFPYLGTALIWTLEQTLGPDQWSNEDCKAWENVYEMMSNEMIKAILENTASGTIGY